MGKLTQNSINMKKTKKCTCCGVRKPLTAFHKANREKDGLVCECKDCVKQRNQTRRTSLGKTVYNQMARDWYNQNHERVTQKRNERRDELRSKAIEYKGCSCEDCGKKVTLETKKSFHFHHVDPSKRKMKVSSMWNYKWETIQEELDKCVLLCKTCRYTRIKSYTAGYWHSL